MTWLGIAFIIGCIGLGSQIEDGLKAVAKEIKAIREATEAFRNGKRP